MHRFAKKAAAILCSASLLAILVGCAQQSSERSIVVSESSAAPTITVTANSEVKAVPDKAEVGVAVTTQDATAEATQSSNAQSVNAVIEALRGLGIQETSIQTTDTWLNPRYDYSMSYSDLDAEGDTSNIVGYEMTTRLAVSDLDIDQIGAVIQACTAAGATNTDGIRYYASEYDAKYAEALSLAVEQARAKAETLAAAGGVQLGEVFSITEAYQNTAYRYDAGMGVMEAAAVSEDSMQVMPGEVNISANVTVSYEIAG